MSTLLIIVGAVVILVLIGIKIKSQWNSDYYNVTGLDDTDKGE